MNQDFLNMYTRGRISEKIGTRLDFDAPHQWTPEIVEVVANAIIKLCPNSVHTQSTYLSRLRNTLRKAGVPEHLIQKTKRPDVTIKHNILGEEARKNAALEGVTAPPPFHTVTGLKTRVERYVWRPPELSVQMAADFMVAFSARPGEALTLNPGPFGTVVGVLKKRDDKEKAFNIVSCLDGNLLNKFLNLWVKIPLEERQQMIDDDLVKQCKVWNINRKDLRKIGAWLAGLGANNVASQMRTIQEATRHAPAARPSADLNYAIVNERKPLKRLISDLREETDASLDEIRKDLVKRQRRSVLQ